MKRLPVFIATQLAGELRQEADGECVFNYQTPESTAFVSLTMPVQPAMTQFFKALLLNQWLQNGDAHLKNFGVLYSSLTDVRLAPIYDVVCTTAYIRQDMQALTLRGTKRFVSPAQMRRFGIEACGLTPRQLERAMDECAQGLAWLASATAGLLDGAGEASRTAMLAHIQRLAQRGLEAHEPGRG